MFTRRIRNRFEMLRGSATLEIPAVQAGHRAFVGVFPPLPDKDVPQWRVRQFEILEEFVDGFP
jgi:hypothetical protein